MWASLFPGQGSQQPGMGRFLFDNFKSAQLLFEEAADTLGLDFKKLCFEGPEADLALTENTQPALLLVSTCAHAAVTETCGEIFKAAAGHSVGEYAAVVTVGALPFAEAMRAVRSRGQAMQTAVPVGQGGMTAVMGPSPEQIKKLCAWATAESGLGVVEPANFNAPGQIVISGSKAALDWLKDNFSAEAFNPPLGKVRFIPLNVSAPFHCSMMAPAEEKMHLVLSSLRFSNARLPVIQNVVAEPVDDGDAICQNLIRQISAPVRWIECMEGLHHMGIRQCIELGPGKVLAGLAKKILGEHMEVYPLQALEDLKSLEAKVQH